MEQSLSSAVLCETHPRLDEVLTRYRRSVHQLFLPSTSEAISKNSLRLGMDIPKELHDFYLQHNGGALFRGLLHIRPLEQLTAASIHTPNVILFAEGPRKEEVWGFIQTEREEVVYGLWENGVFVAMHDCFSQWLDASIYLLDEGISSPERQYQYRRSQTPNHPFFVMESITTAVSKGEIEEALSLFSTHYRLLDQWPQALVLYADCIRIQGGCAEPLYVRAMRQTSLPSPYPSYLPLDFDFIHQGIENEIIDELASFLDARVFDIHHEHEYHFVEHVLLLLASHHRKNSRRVEAKKCILDCLSQAAGYSFSAEWRKPKLLLCDILIELGEHEQAESMLRGFLDGEGRFEAQLRLGEMAILRQEPFANQILDRLITECSDRLVCSKAKLAQVEGYLYMNQPQEAQELLKECAIVFRQMNQKKMMTKVLMFRGDIAQQLGSIGTAHREYQYAIELAIETHEEEMRCRIWERQTELLSMTGDTNNARQTYQVIRDCLQLMELPVRTAWVCLKQGRCGDDLALVKARELFKSFDIASGVGFVDLLLGCDAQSIEWHINSSQKYAQLRLRALRGVRPYTRQDSERFERRLACHRKAISDLDDSIVDVLSSEIISLERDLVAVPISSFSYPLSRYIALINLLVSHRSYRAADKLFSIVEMERPLSSSTRRVLVEALCRSRNMILIDGLLRMVSEQKKGMGIASEVLGYRREKQALEPLIKILSAQVILPVRKSAIAALGLIGDSRAIEPLLTCLKVSELAEDTAMSLLLLGEWKGLDEKAQLLVKPGVKSTRLLGEMVGRYGGPSYFLLLKQALEEEEARSLGACTGLGYMGDPRIVPELIHRSGSRNPKVSAVASYSLELITGHFEPADEPLLRPRWQTWWDKHHRRFVPGCRYRLGKPMTLGQLIEHLKDDNRVVRQAAYDELVISSGTFLPFDIDGPWRVQQSHLFAWQQWWKENESKFTAGRWLFQGEQIG